MRLGFACLLSLLPLALSPDEGRAQTARDPVAAETLFKEGVKLLDENKWDEACVKFRKSMDFDPSVGTLINVARCSAHEGKSATAWGQFAEAQRMNLNTEAGKRRDGLAQFIKKSQDELEPKVPRVRILMQSTPDGLTISRDGTIQSNSAIGEALPIDPGEHVFAAKAPGFSALERRVTLSDGQKLDLELKLEPLSAATTVSTSPKPTPTVAPPVAPRSMPELPESGPSGMAIAGYTLLAVGGASAVVGGVFGGLAIGKKGQIPEGCDLDTKQCATSADQTIANDVSDTGSTFATLSSVLIPVGAGVAAGGLILVLVAPSSTDDDPEKTAASKAAFVPWISPGLAGGEVRVSW